MSQPRQSFTDTHILGQDTETLIVRSTTPDPRRWMKDSPVCKLLEQRHILHAGIMLARPPFEVVRTDQSGTFFLACFGGSGSILSDGNWREVAAGEACLLPPHTVNALKVGDSEAWSFAWVRYLEPQGVVPIATAKSPARGEFDANPLKAAIEGLRGELAGDDSAAAVQHHWVELIHAYVLRFATPVDIDDRVWKAWAKVETDLGGEWSLDLIASEACMSPEHFRRLCLKAVGRSPIKHLTYLRMRRAAEILATTDDKVETVARALGYENQFAFSNTFLKWIGVRPSEHRKEMRSPST